MSHKTKRLGLVASWDDMNTRNAMMHPAMPKAEYSTVSNHRDTFRRRRSTHVMNAATTNSRENTAHGVRYHGVGGRVASGLSDSVLVPETRGRFPIEAF